MQLKNCKECGKLFMFQLSEVCPECVAKEDEDFKRVKEFLHSAKETPANVDELSDMTGVSAKRIIKFVRQGRLQFAKASLNCEGCGAPIEEGRFCAICKAKMMQGLNSNNEPAAPQQPKTSSSKGNKMFTAELMEKGRK